MKMKPTHKDFYMEIRKSPGRFLSILFIVALGVAFFSGIRASEPDMRLTGDTYFDESNLMDIKTLSTYGVTQDDVDAILKIDGVEHAEGAYSADFMQIVDKKQKVLHVISLQDEMNQVKLSDGRMPQKAGECLADQDAGYKVGDIIKLRSGTSDEVIDTLTTDTLKVVGLCSSPMYISYGRGSATIGTGTISAFVMVPEETFDMDVYTEVYVQVKGAKNEVAFTDGYDKKVEKVLDQIEDITDERAEIRKQELVNEAQEKIDEAREELEQGRADAASELADAAAKIADAEEQLTSGKAQITSGKKQIASAKNTLSKKESELEQAQNQYNAGLAQLQEGEAQYEAGLAQYEAAKPEAEAKIQTGREEIDKKKQELATAPAQLEVLKQSVAGLEQKQTEGTITVEEAATLKELKENQIPQLEDFIANGEQLIASGEAELDAAQKQLDDTAATLAQTKSELDAAKASLNGVPQQLASGKAQIQSGWTEIRKQEKKLEEGAAEIAENEAKVAEAKIEYANGEEEAAQKIAEGEQKIADAEAKVQDIEKPTWYVYDRDTLTEYSGYGENAERLGAIGRVFPVLFFLVAALISLTSMTRMVEEQRTAIGTMKALGYSKMSIAKKYLGYALIATAGGSVLGVLIGEKILPYIIVYAYGILYQHITHILIPYQWIYAWMAAAAAIVCTMAATFFACYKELVAQPAVLMRPPAPKNGQRVFLERIKFIWKHLSFTWKSCIRNLTRYKKRFFMTVFGIGGCMGLMLVGYGIKDSCYEIAELQFRDIQMYDGSVYLKEDISDETRQNLLDYMKDDSDISHYMQTSMKNVTLVNGKNKRDAYQVVFSEPKDVKDYFDFHDRKSKEEYTLDDEGVIISEKTGKLLNAKAGDTIEIKDEENGNKKVKIAHICENYMGHYIFFTPSYYEKVYGENSEYNSIFFAGQKGDTQEDYNKIGEDILTQDGALSVSYMRDIEKQLDDMLKSLNLVIVVLIISAGMLAFVVLYNLNTVNITERQRELATLKVLGFYDLEVAEHVYRENVLLTFIGAAVGVVLGKFLHAFIIDTVEVDTAMFGRNINFSSYMYSLLFTILFSLIVNGIMYFKLKKIDMVESLKSIE
ncbi:ABC transporter permease [Dorea formicigenerans]|uniref:ABC transporter permease n=1 Tax=Dorea formicigenerans TaxID=39486 RepID=A0A3E5EMJ1_9FIRM|nr:ABC transporter permease [Dorea formicigenerans]RGJ63578.1 ABC transporter permease [Dorea formicigenerans]RGN90189.1 ABC transporter permease [Dorea formicigenerans]RGT37958.1 ABC transporter permease [Dorea formicigenerans]